MTLEKSVPPLGECILRITRARANIAKELAFIILVFSYLKINSLVIPYLKNIFNIP